MLREVSYRAIHILGSLGVTDLTPLQAMWAASPTMSVMDGVDEVHKVTVARNVLKGYQPHEGPWPTDYLPAKREEARKKFAEAMAADPESAQYSEHDAAAPGRGLSSTAWTSRTGWSSSPGGRAGSAASCAGPSPPTAPAGWWWPTSTRPVPGGWWASSRAAAVGRWPCRSTWPTSRRWSPWSGQTREAFGPIDLFCANAGILVGGGVEVPDPDWERMWAVNVMSHVYAARTVLPAMIERGEGYLLHTASAAGLLTQLGSAPYSVTKHAVVALAEWLSITHAADGIKVSCLCPQGVWTNMTGAPTEEADRLLSATAGRNGMLMPEEVASVVVEALADERFLVLPHPEVATFEQRRAATASAGCDRCGGSRPRSPQPDPPADPFAGPTATLPTSSRCLCLQRRHGDKPASCPSIPATPRRVSPVTGWEQPSRALRG